MRMVLALAVAINLAACSAGGAQPASSIGVQSGSAAPAGGATTAPIGGGGGSASSLAVAAAEVKDWCALLPADLIAKFAPGAPPVSAGPYPGECGASNGTSALDFRYSTGFGSFSVASGAETVPNLAAGAYMDRPTKDEVELWVALQIDPDVELFIDMAGHDGKDHKADAIAFAQATLAKLQ